ncbi:unnamed protein product [Didymodactylos carnosus]|uniref:Deltamethrin resistance protein prag01 domain-containing protein n=1 Tax=Didymodactylos carnosus TaxID=1234261 RepID=A0A8S2NJ74_9BILA|nr:unnamed protein product [Didymodactylos carnosus]CAF4004536.1 unnamed protein product [Didymodactylos carnosus]
MKATNLCSKGVPLMLCRRTKGYGEVDTAHGHGHDGHVDRHQVLYERMWKNKSTYDWLPKPQGSWAEANAKKQSRYNQVLIAGIASISLATFYVLTVTEKNAGARYRAPYHLIGHEDFPGSKYLDVQKPE